MSDRLPVMTESGRERLVEMKRDNKKGFWGIGRGKNADYEDAREEMFGHRSRFIKVQYQWPGGRKEWLHHCLECRHGIRNKMPRDHHRDCSWYREEALSKWMREGVEA